MRKDVHTEHCCLIHGCKYADEDCTVTTGKLQQSYTCESCDYEDIKSLKQLKATYPAEFGIELLPIIDRSKPKTFDYDHKIHDNMTYIQQTILNKLSVKDLKNLLILAGYKFDGTPKKEILVELLGDRLS